MKIILNENDKIIKFRNNIGYIYDKITKSHLFITSEIMEYITNASKNELTIDKFIECFEDNNDKKYIEILVNNLMKIGYIENATYNKNNLNKKTPKFKSIYLMVTKRCNLYCQHCSSRCSPNEKEVLSTDDIKRTISNIVNLSPQSVIFTGGEPLLRSDLEEILEYAKGVLLKSKFALSTNATLINNKNIEFICRYFDKVDISIDGVNKKTCEDVRGKGVFDKVIQSIKILKKNKIYDISLSMVFGENNFDLRDEFLKLNEHLETIPIVRTFIPKGRGIDNVLKFNKGINHLPLSISKLYEISNDNKNVSKNISSCACNAFEESMYIDAEGNAYPCPSLTKEKYKIVNLACKDLEIEEIYNSILNAKNKFLDSIYYKDSKCENCDLNIFCWNCPAVFENAKEYNEIQIWCDSMKSNLSKIIWG